MIGVRMKILMLGWELPPHNAGGMGVVCYHLSKALSLDGVEIDFVVPYSANHDDINFMKVHCATDETPLIHYGLGAYSRDVGSGSTSGLSSLEKIQNQYEKYVESVVQDNDFDAIHAHDWLTVKAGIKAKKLTNKPLVVHVHATEFDRGGGQSGNPIIHEIEYQGLMMADRIVAVSEYTKSIIVYKYQIPEDKVEVMHNAFDVDSLEGDYQYDGMTYKYIEGLKNEGYTIVTAITRFTLSKGLDHLLRAVAKAIEKNNRIALLLAGDGEQRDSLIELASQLGISDRVFFTGYVRGKRWRDSYSVADIFVMSSVSEPFGISALEAAHHDNALIITNQSGVNEILHNTFKYDFWDIDKLADQIVGISTSTALRASLQQNVKDEYAKLSWRDVASDLERLYGSISIKGPAR